MRRFSTRLYYLTPLVFFYSQVSLAEKNTDLGYSVPSVLLDANLGLGYDSNLYDTASDPSASYYYQPDIKIGTNLGGEVFNAQVGYEYTLFAPEKNDDVTQIHILNINTNWSPTLPNQLYVSALQGQSDEKRGQGLTDNAPFSVEKLDSYLYDKYEFGYNFSYPHQESLLFEFLYGQSSKTYSSNRIEALNANLEQTNVGLNVGYKWEQNKKIFIGSNYKEQDYLDIPDQSKNSANRIAFVGLEWKFTSVIDVSMSVGKEKKRFDISGNKIDTDYWNASMLWSPLYHTRFLLETENQQQPITESNQTLNELETILIGWEHIWGIDYKTSFSLTQGKTKSIIGNVTELEKAVLFSVKAFYHDFELSVNWQSDRDSTDATNSSQYYVLFAYNLKGGF